MPIYEPDHVEYVIAQGNMHVAMEDGSHLLGYWAYPDFGGKFPGIVLIHDWWGITDVERRIANLFAQVGYYVIVPDLFGGKVATTPQEAMALVETLGKSGYAIADKALAALEHHVRCNQTVAAVGLGMGGSLAFEAALTRHDLEAAIAFYGFPNRYLKRFKNAKTPILALYGSGEPYVSPNMIAQLKAALAESPLRHEVVTIEGVARDFFNSTRLPNTQAVSKIVWTKTLEFLDRYLEPPSSTAGKVVRRK
jgi:carboxymethylenebutenolidase